jgi:rubrerythrin
MPEMRGVHAGGALYEEAEMPIMKFKCANCGLPMIMTEEPKSCIECGSTNIIRQGWIMRAERMAKNVC